MPTLAEYMQFLLETEPPGEFKPCAHYNREGDQIEVYWSDESCYTRQHGHVLAVHYSEATHQPVGVTVYSIKHLLAQHSMLSREPARAERERRYAEWKARQA